MFTVYGLQLIFVDSFKYLGHIICYNLFNDAIITKEIHNLYICTNIMLHRLSSCSMYLKVRLYCLFCCVFIKLIVLSKHNSYLFIYLFFSLMANHKEHYAMDYKQKCMQHMLCKKNIYMYLYLYIY